MSSLELLQKEVVGRSWYRADLDRGGAESLLRELPVGHFVVRPSSKPNCVALSFKQENEAIGHNVICLEHDASRVPPVAFRFANGSESFSSIKKLLKSLPLLKFGIKAVKKERETPPTAPDCVAPPRRESRLVTATIGAERDNNERQVAGQLQTQLERFVALLPVDVAPDMAALTALEGDVEAARESTVRALVERTRGPIPVRIFMGGRQAGATYATLKIGKSTTARDVCRLVCAKRLCPSYHRALELYVEGDGQAYCMQDIDRPAPLQVLWSVRRRGDRQRAFVLRLREDLCGEPTSPPPNDAPAPSVATAPAPATATKPKKGRRDEGLVISSPVFNAAASERQKLAFMADAVAPRRPAGANKPPPNDTAVSAPVFNAAATEKQKAAFLDGATDRRPAASRKNDAEMMLDAQVASFLNVVDTATVDVARYWLQRAGANVEMAINMYLEYNGASGRHRPAADSVPLPPRSPPRTPNVPARQRESALSNVSSGSDLYINAPSPRSSGSPRGSRAAAAPTRVVSPAIRDAFSGGGQRPASHGVAPLPSSNGAAFDVELQQRLARKAETNAADEGARSPVLEKQAVASAPQVPPARAKLLDSGVTQYDSRAPSLNSSLVNAGASGPDDDALETDDPYGFIPRRVQTKFTSAEQDFELDQLDNAFQDLASDLALENALLETEQPTVTTSDNPFASSAPLTPTTSPRSSQQSITDRGDYGFIHSVKPQRAANEPMSTDVEFLDNLFNDDDDARATNDEFLELDDLSDFDAVDHEQSSSLREIFDDDEFASMLAAVNATTNDIEAEMRATRHP